MELSIQKTKGHKIQKSKVSRLVFIPTCTNPAVRVSSHHFIVHTTKVTRTYAPESHQQGKIDNIIIFLYSPTKLSPLPETLRPIISVPSPSHHRQLEMAMFISLMWQLEMIAVIKEPRPNMGQHFLHPIHGSFQKCAITSRKQDCSIHIFCSHKITKTKYGPTCSASDSWIISKMCNNIKKTYIFSTHFNVTYSLFIIAFIQKHIQKKESSHLSAF